MRKKLIASAGASLVALVGVAVHDFWAVFLVEERIAGVLLAAGADARPWDALLALLFVAGRAVGFPLTLATLAAAATHAASAAFNRRSRRRSGTRGAPGSAPR